MKEHEPGTANVTAEATPAQDENSTPVSPNTVTEAAGTTTTTEPSPGAAAALEGLQAELSQAIDQLQRERASFQNYKRRTEKELADSRLTGAQDAVIRFFPIFDDFERALNNIPAELQGNPWMNGVELILRNYHKLLDEFNIQPLDPVGQPFDPSRHEAVGTDDHPNAESSTVTVTLQKGYLAGDRVLRPALVRIAN